jgi:hypothetical protein
VHPIERLRYVARAEWAPPALLASEAAWGLGELAQHEEAAVLPACRRLIDRHPGCGPLWWVAARILTAGDPVAEAGRCADALDDDLTADLLAEELDAIRRVVRHGGMGEVAGAEVVVVQSDAIGVGGMVIDGDDIGMIEAARAAEVPVWVEAGVGRVLPPKLWDALSARLHGARASHTGVVVSLQGVDHVAGPSGTHTVRLALESCDCPEPPELLSRW